MAIDNPPPERANNAVIVIVAIIAFVFALLGVGFHLYQTHSQLDLKAGQVDRPRIQGSTS